MTGIEIFLLIVGCVFMIGSFFISEKLSASELNKIAELSESELGKIIDKGMQNAEHKIDDVIDEKIEESAIKAERAMEKESNEKIMAISEYSDTVVDSMKKTHDEIMFLYSMLNDKHSELTSLSGNLQRLAADIRDMQTTPQKAKEVGVIPTVHSVATEVMYKVEEPLPVVTQEPVLEENMKSMESIGSQSESEVEDDEQGNHNEMILQLYRDGMSKVDIARKLSLGLGEVSLVIGLYKGDE